MFSRLSHQLGILAAESPRSLRWTRSGSSACIPDNMIFFPMYYYITAMFCRLLIHFFILSISILILDCGVVVVWYVPGIARKHNAFMYMRCTLLTLQSRITCLLLFLFSEAFLKKKNDGTLMHVYCLHYQASAESSQISTDK